MNKICVGIAFLFFVLFSQSCAVSQQGKIQTFKNQEDGNLNMKWARSILRAKAFLKITQRLPSGSAKQQSKGMLTPDVKFICHC